MLKNSVITNTWKCDSCGTEIISETDPFYKIYISNNSFGLSPLCNIDLCSICISQITTQFVIDWIASNG